MVATARVTWYSVNCQLMPPARQNPDRRNPENHDPENPSPAHEFPDRRPLLGPTRQELANREQIDWHDHAEHQLIHAGRGLLQVFTPAGSWVVPSHRAVWIPAGIAHSHRAHGPTRMQTLAFPSAVNPLSLNRPTILAVSPLLREVIVSLTADVLDPQLTDQQRRNLMQVALDHLRPLDASPPHLPAPTDPRLRDVAAILCADPADQRSLAELGAAVGASERTLSRLISAEIGMGFARWRTQLRLHHSIILLAGGVPVATTASACGYGNASAFIESFRQAFGTTPGRYWAD
jgi:AraC-like DNA-binding protein